MVGTTASGASHAKEAILSGQSGDTKDRLTTLDMDVCDEQAIEKAAHSVKEKFGKDLRLLVNVSGIVSTSLSRFTDSYCADVRRNLATCREESVSHQV